MYCIAGAELKIVQQSPAVVEMTSFCALYCVAYPHKADTLYEWKVFPKSVVDPVLANAPVLYVSTPGSYVCTVWSDSAQVESDIVVVHFVPRKCVFVTLTAILMLEVVDFSLAVTASSSESDQDIASSGTTSMHLSLCQM